MAISKISAQNLSHLSNLESHCAKESAELRRGDREGHYGRCLTHFQIRAKEYATLMEAFTTFLKTAIIYSSCIVQTHIDL